MMPPPATTRSGDHQARDFLVAVDEVSAGYGTMEVLSGVSLRVTKGEVVALLGANGAGKTTLLRTMAGLLPARTGRVVLNDIDVTRARPAQRARLGLCLIPEGRGIFRSLTVADNLALAIPPWRKETRPDAVVELFPVLASRMHQRAGLLSGGQQQMLALARAFLADPSLVLVDELSMGLAPLVVQELFEHLRLLADRGCAIVLVEQYVSQALAMADTAYLLAKGRIVHHGPAATLDEATMALAYLGDAEHPHASDRHRGDPTR
jgi:branched-chain amino acid transport system ATP-binding protein